MKSLKRVKCSLVLGALFFAVQALATPVGTAITYQGNLTQLGTDATGPFDFVFEMWDSEAGGATVGVSQTIDDIDVVNGVFTVELDFGSAPYTGEQLWLGISVREGARTDGYISLLPRQKLNVVPYALHTLSVEAGAIGVSEVDSSKV